MSSTTKSPYEVILRPIVTEKSVRGSDVTEEEARKYTFAVATNANKYEIATALESIQLDVKNPVNVVTVNIVKVHGKSRVGRFFKRSNRGVSSDWKKAVVTLKAGQQIEIVEGV